jgi:superfamily II DNA or RNA helicase
LCYLKDEEDLEFIRVLDDELSFRVLGAEHTKAFKGYFIGRKFIKWDGVHRILSSNLTFPYGLLSRVQNLYDRYNKVLDIISDKDNPSPNNSIEILGRLRELKKYPRPYQFDVLNAVKRKDNGIIRAATGAGKTIVAAMMIGHFGKKTILYVIGKDLLYQTHDFFSKVFDEKVGIIGDGLCDIADINIMSVWTVGKALGLKSNKIIEDLADGEKDVGAEKYREIKDAILSAKVHIFDECHLSSCDTIQTISKNINPEHIYGMSASPWRDDNSDLLIEAVFGGKIIDISASELIKQGYLVKPIIKFLNVPKYPEKLKKSYQTIYKHYITDNDVRNAKVIKGAIKLVEQGFQPLVSYSRITHGKTLYKEISKHIPCILLSGKDSADVRRDAKEKLESGQIKAILASTIFDIGVDLPSLSGLIVAGGGQSSVRSLQRIGRVIRPHPGKEFAAVIDFLDNEHFLKKHSLSRKKIYSIEEEFDIKWPI